MISSLSELDLNLDGVFDDRDKEVVYDFDFAILTSHMSFSCGNLLPVMAQKYGIPILGETSGGSCMVSVGYLPSTNYYAFSGCKKMVCENGEDVDSGAAVDFKLTKRVFNKYTQHYMVTYKGLYDLKSVSAKTEAFYGKGILGDANLDGEVEITDATTIQRYDAKMIELNDAALPPADVDKDGDVCVLDATWLQCWLLKMKAPEGIGEPINV